MKENRYDDESFFQKYSKMSRSVYGLAGAGEWRELQKLLPDFQGKRVLDIGCGYGWHCAYAADSGAKEVFGTDLSEKMLRTAKERNLREHIVYMRCAMEDLDFEADRFDVIISSLAFHYTEDYKGLVKRMNKWLVPGGRLVFSVEHPVFTAYGTQDWQYDGEGKIQHFPVDNYYYEGKREAIFLEEKIIKYHRTLTTYLATLLEAGFTIRGVIEPMPPEEMMDMPGMKDEMRRPMMLLVSAEKTAERT